MTSKNGKATTASGSNAATQGPTGTDPGGEPPAMDTNSAIGLNQPAPELDAKIQRHLGQKLKASYDDLIRQPVPDKFRELLEELERKEKPK